MKPGEAGGMEPSTCLLLRRRQSAQQPKAKAAAASRPKGMPTPRPIFWSLERLPLGGAASSEVGVEDGVLDGLVRWVEDESVGDGDVEASEVEDCKDEVVNEVELPVVGDCVATLPVCDAPSPVSAGRVV